MSGIWIPAVFFSDLLQSLKRSFTANLLGLTTPFQLSADSLNFPNSNCPLQRMLLRSRSSWLTHKYKGTQNLQWKKLLNNIRSVICGKLSTYKFWLYTTTSQRFENLEIDQFYPLFLANFIPCFTVGIWIPKQSPLTHFYSFSYTGGYYKDQSVLLVTPQLIKNVPMENETSITLGGTITLLTLFAQNLIFGKRYQLRGLIPVL